jgi:hypothetical protein
MTKHGVPIKPIILLIKNTAFNGRIYKESHHGIRYQYQNATAKLLTIA